MVIGTLPKEIEKFRLDVSLFDYFAAKAMQGLVNRIFIDQGTEDMLKKAEIKPTQFPQYLAYLSYEAAEAMMIEREKRFHERLKKVAQPKAEKGI